MQQLLGTGDLARLIGIARHRIEYAVSNGSIAEPAIRIANKRAFSLEEAQRIADYFGVKVDSGDDIERGGT